MDLQQLKGVGEKTIEHFYQSNIYNLEELVSYYPYKYQILQPDTLEDSDEKVTLTINATVTDSGKVSYIRKNFNSLRFKVESYGKIINVTIFNRAFLKTHLRVGKEITLIGKYNNKTNMFTANDIKLSKLEGTEIIQVYHLIKGLKNNSLHTIIVEALKEIKLEDYIPETYQSKYQLLSKQEAIKKIHIPKNTEEIKEAKRTLIYEELFIFMFKIQYLKSL